MPHATTGAEVIVALTAAWVGWKLGMKFHSQEMAMKNRTLQLFKTVERPIRVSNGVRAAAPPTVISCVPIPRKVISPVLRQAAERIRVKGFTVMFGHVEGPACFMGSINYAIANMYGFQDIGMYLTTPRKLWDTANDFVERLIFNADHHAFDEDSLEAEGWTAQDAAAALDMAADYAEAIGR